MQKEHELQEAKSILDFFPQIKPPRDIQIEIGKQIDASIKSGFDTIVVSAPTGVGKSWLVTAIAKYFEDSFVVTASKQLQDQYIRDFKFLKPVKGKSNFACYQLMDHDKLDHKELKKAIEKGLTCEKGRCKKTTGKDGKKTEYCKYKPQIEEIRGGSENNFCLYYKQKYEALLAPHSLWNYSAYFQLMKYGRDFFGQYMQRSVGVYDEAHTIEDQIIQFMGIEITKKTIDECDIQIKSYDLTNIDLVLALLEDITRSYDQQIRALAESRSYQENPDPVKMARLENKRRRFVDAYVDIKNDKENYVINDPRYDADKNFRSVSIVPLDISSYVEQFFEIPLRVFMSATINKDGFCETMGFDPKDVSYIDTPRSPFAAENRRIEFLNIAKLSKSKSTIEDELSIITKIDDILTNHSKDRGLILTSSFSRCIDIKSNLSPPNKKRIKICHSMNENGKTQNEILEEHAKSENSVLLSSSLWEGVDLKDELSRFQIIAKTPFPSLGNKRTRIKIRRFPLWYKSQTITKMLQGFGRSVRNENDRAVTYVLDSAAQELLDNWRDKIPLAFHDVLWPQK